MIIASRQHTQDMFLRKAATSNDRLAPIDPWIDGDSLQQIGFVHGSLGQRFYWRSTLVNVDSRGHLP